MTKRPVQAPARPPGPLELGPRVLRRRAPWLQADGRVVLEVPKAGRFGTKLLRALRIRPTLRLRLDALGSAAWLHLEGRTAAGLLALLEQSHPDEPELGPRLGRFLGMLWDKGLVDIGPAPPET